MGDKNGQRLLVMAGGTGGHVFPGVSVAHHLMAQGWEVRWLGCADRIEATLVPTSGIEIDFIKISGIRNRGWRQLLAAPWSIYRAVRQATSVIMRFQPHVVLGLGGYVSGPGGIAAWLAGVPIVLHEQNAVFGLTNRCLAYFAKRVLVAFPGSAMPTAEVVGNPLRTTLLQLAKPQVRFAARQGPLRLLILGGSQGARILNQVVPTAAAALGNQVTIWHQVGKDALQTVTQAYQQAALSHPLESALPSPRINEFIEDMAAAYAWADLVICRAGALTISELAAVGLPAILVPYQHADRQQYLNAQVLQRAGAAEILEEPHFTAAQLAQIITRYDRTSLGQRAVRAQACAMFDATQRIASVLQAIAERSVRSATTPPEWSGGMEKK